MFLIGISGQSGGFDPLVLLLAGLLVEALVGNVSNSSDWAGNPSNFIRRYVLWCNHKLNRESRSEGDRAIRGGLALLLLVTFLGGLGWLIASLSQEIHLIWLLEVGLIVFSINQRGTHAQIQRIIRALNIKDVDAANRVLSQATYKTVDQMDTVEIFRSGIELCAIALTKDVFAPVFWYILFGLPGLLVFSSVSIMSQTVGDKTKKYRAFGFAASRLDDILKFVPARIAGVFVVIAAIFVPTAKPKKSFQVMFRDAAKYHSLITGWPLSAMAGALRIAIPSSRKLLSEVVPVSWIGNGSAKITARDISLVLYLFSVSCLLNVAFVAGLTALRIV